MKKNKLEIKIKKKTDINYTYATVINWCTWLVIHSVIRTLNILTLANFRHWGESCWHGPHHGAKKSTTHTSSVFLFLTASSNDDGVSDTTTGCNISYINTIQC